MRRRVFLKWGPIDPKKWSDFAANLYYQEGEYGNAEDFKKLAQRLDDLSAEKKLGGNRLFYLSTPPEVYPHIVEQLGARGIGEAFVAGRVGAHHYREAIWARLDVGKKH